MGLDRQALTCWGPSPTPPRYRPSRRGFSVSARTQHLNKLAQHPIALPFAVPPVLACLYYCCPPPALVCVCAKPEAGGTQEPSQRLNFSTEAKDSSTSSSYERLCNTGSRTTRSATRTMPSPCRSGSKPITEINMICKRITGSGGTAVCRSFLYGMSSSVAVRACGSFKFELHSKYDLDYVSASDRPT